MVLYKQMRYLFFLSLLKSYLTNILYSTMYRIENRNEKLLGAEAFSGLKCQGFILNLKGSLHVPKLIFQYINLVKDFSLLCKPCLTVFICRSSYLQQISAAYLSDIVTLCAAVYTACSEFSLPLLKIY